jgi:hypothetical protein
MMQVYRGERMPEAAEMWTLSKSIRRTQLKDNNRLQKQTWEYESEDEMGEDLGIKGDDDDLD